MAVGDTGFPLLLCVLFDTSAGWPSWTGWQEMSTKVKTQAPCKMACLTSTHVIFKEDRC